MGDCKRVGAKERSSRLRWRPEEDRLLRHHYGKVDAKAMLLLLPGRSWDSIRRRSHDLGMQPTAEFGDSWGKRWTKAELDLLGALMQRGHITDDEMLSALPGRSINAINHQIRWLRRACPELTMSAQPRGSVRSCVAEVRNVASSATDDRPVPLDLADEVVDKTDAIRSTVLAVAEQHGLQEALAPVLVATDEIDGIVIESL